MRTLTIASFVSWLMLNPLSASADVDSGTLSMALIQWVGEQGAAAPPLEEGWPRLEAALYDHYAARDWHSIWFEGGVAEGAARLSAAAAVLEDAAREGLDPGDYPLSVDSAEIPDFAMSADPQDLAALEIETTAALLAFAHDATVGRSDPRKRDPNVFAEERTFNAGPVLAEFSDSTSDAAALLRGMSPGHAEYRGLRRALSSYRTLAQQPEPPKVSEGPSLKVGMRDGRVAALRARLAYFGEISISEAAPELFTPSLEIALQSFQRRHGLEDDGIAGRMTLAALNVSADERVEQILLNLERWRWLPRDLGDEYVLANIAGFNVTMVADGVTVDRMRAVVGRPYRMSPVFSDEISYIEVNPTWTVPPRIARNDLLPKIKADPTFLASGGYQVFSGWGADASTLDPSTIDWADVSTSSFPYKLRQAPGAMNALGEVKIMFPNRFNVYLHDSPARDLFAKPSRAFSSGCIRLQRPFDLVQWLLQLTGGPDREAIETIRASGETTVVKLPRRVPVHLIYATAWAGEEGQIQFRDDVYGRDALLREALSN